MFQTSNRQTPSLRQQPLLWPLHHPAAPLHVPVASVKLLFLRVILILTRLTREIGNHHRELVLCGGACTIVFIEFCIFSVSFKKISCKKFSCHPFPFPFPFPASLLPSLHDHAMIKMMNKLFSSSGRSSSNSVCSLQQLLQDDDESTNFIERVVSSTGKSKRKNHSDRKGERRGVGGVAGVGVSGDTVV